MNICVITGASSGLGKEFALQLDKMLNLKNISCDEFWILARREEKLNQLSALLKHKTKIFSVDLLTNEGINKYTSELSKCNPNVKVLVNASGFGKIGTNSTVSLNEQLNMISLNCSALTAITAGTIPYMSAGAKIIQIASSAAYAPVCGMGVYAATKAYVLSYSKSLRAELKIKKINVTAVCPGPVKTEFFDVAQQSQKLKLIEKYNVMSSAYNVVNKAIKKSFKNRSVSTDRFWVLMIKLFSVIYPKGMMKLFEGDK